MNNKHLSGIRKYKITTLLLPLGHISFSPTHALVNNLDYIAMILTPMESWCWSCFAPGRGLVNESATFRFVCILQISMSPSLTWSRMDLMRLLMCLVLLWNLDSFAKAIAPVLSQKIFIRPDALGTTPRSNMNPSSRLLHLLLLKQVCTPLHM